MMMFNLRSPLRKLLAIGAITALLSITSCASDPTAGYSTHSVYPRSISTVAVPIFENETFERGFEFDLADALVKSIEARTPYKVTRERRADTALTGRIVNIRRDRLSKSRTTGLAEEVIYIVTIEFEWRDTRSGEVLTARRDFTGDSLFTPSAPSGETQDLARFATAQKLADDIVDEMQSAW
ncbi:MAG: LPS assembly lipoprotein LptE [Phycisphaerales bacterium]